MKRIFPIKIWLLSGPLEHWACEHYSKWGVKDNHQKKSCWDKLRVGDIVFFYAQAPTQGLVGMGIVSGFNYQSIPLWPEEVRENKNEYPYRIYFEPILKVTGKSKKSVIKVDKLGLITNAAISAPGFDTLKKLSGKAQSEWGVYLPTNRLWAVVELCFYWIKNRINKLLSLIVTVLNLLK